MIVLLHELLQRIGADGLRLKLSSLGNPDTRREYLDELKQYLRANENKLSEEVRSRIDLKPWGRTLRYGGGVFAKGVEKGFLPRIP